MRWIASRWPCVTCARARGQERAWTEARAARVRGTRPGRGVRRGRRPARAEGWVRMEGRPVWRGGLYGGAVGLYERAAARTMRLVEEPVSHVDVSISSSPLTRHGHQRCSSALTIS
eukprot:4966669-Prymnesium_polylepis.1